MLNFIQAVEDSTSFTIDCFNGMVVFEVRVLSPIEAEAAGMSTSMVASSMMDSQQLSKIMKNKDRLSQIDFSDPQEDDLEVLLNMMDGFKPEQLLGIEEAQNKILCQVVRKASEDGGETFQQIHLVQGYDQQDPANNRLWVGNLSKEDRTAILERAMSGHKEAADRLGNFRQVG